MREPICDRVARWLDDRLTRDMFRYFVLKERMSLTLRFFRFIRPITKQIFF